MTEREASCSCGRLRVIATGGPVRVSICHCLACQQRTGSAFGYQARFPADRVRVSGEASEFVRVSVWEERKHSWVVPPEPAEHIY